MKKAIFFLSKNPIEAAQWTCDDDLFYVMKTCVHIIVNFSNFLRKIPCDTDFDLDPEYNDLINYDIIIHWMNESPANVRWILRYCVEISHNYLKIITPANLEYIDYVSFVIDDFQKIHQNYKYSYLNADTVLTEFPWKCLPDYCRISTNVIVCYQFYYINYSKNSMKWAMIKEIPSWYDILKNSRGGKVPRSRSKRTSPERPVKCLDVKKQRGFRGTPICYQHPPEDPFIVYRLADD